MKILALETTSTVCSVALLIGDVIKSCQRIAPMQQTKLVLPMISDILKDNALSLYDIDYIAFSRGPGAFTGVRIASSVAQGLAYSAGKSIVAVSSLAVLAQSAWFEQGCSEVLVAVDARMGKVYWANYQLNSENQMVLIDKEILCTPDSIPPPKNKILSAVGDGWGVHGEMMFSLLPHKPAFVYRQQLPKAEAILTLAKANVEQGISFNSHQALPIYL